MKPTIGIIGGSGPLATLDIEQKILTATQELTKPLTDQDYFNIVVFNYSGTHDRNDSVFFGQKDPLFQYIKYITSISALNVDLILLACNTAHIYFSILKEKTKIPIISIIEKTISYLREIFPDCHKVGLISTKATLEKKLYHNLLSIYDIETVSISASAQDLIMKAIYLIKAGISLTKEEPFLKNTNSVLEIETQQATVLKDHPYKHILLQQDVPNPKIIIQEAIEELKNKGCQHIIFGCTELPLVLPFLKKEPDVHILDPNRIIAQAIVETLHHIECQSSQDLRVLNNRRYI